MHLQQEAPSQSWSWGCGCPRARHPPPACERARESRPHAQPLLAELRGLTPFRLLTRAPHPGPRGPRDPPVRTPDDAAPGSGQTAQREEEARGLKRSCHKSGRCSPAGRSLTLRKRERQSARRPAELADGPAGDQGSSASRGAPCSPPARLAALHPGLSLTRRAGGQNWGLVRVPSRSGAHAELLGPGDAGPALQSPESRAGWQTEAQRQFVGKAGPRPCV